LELRLGTRESSIEHGNATVGSIVTFLNRGRRRREQFGGCVQLGVYLNAHCELEFLLLRIDFVLSATSIFIGGFCFSLLPLCFVFEVFS
jgi:hypothetical protein